MEHIPLPQSNADNQEKGAILVVVLVLVFAVTLALLAYLYLNKNNSLIASNLAVQNIAQEATDQGLQTANQWLQNNDPVTSQASWYYSSMSDVPSTYGASGTGVLEPPAASFWSTCAGNNQCNSQTVVSNEMSYQVEYVMFPSAGIPTPINGYQITGHSAYSYQYYVVYVHAQRRENSGLGVTIQAVLRKITSTTGG
jgi:Tfp pilus assembly protein PilX